MRSLRMLCSTVGLLTLSTLGATVAKADSISIALQANAQTFNMNFQKLDSNGITVSNVTNQGARAGYFRAVLNGNPPPFTVYCVDIQGRETDPQTVTVVPVSVPAPTTHYDGLIGTYRQLTEAAWLMDTYDDVTLANNGVLADSSGINGAAMQAAIWNVIDGDTDFTVSTGVFNIVKDGFNNANYNAIVTQADFYLKALSNALNGLTPGTNGVDPGVLYSAVNRPLGGQDLLGGRDAPGNPRGPNTPEGASLLMFLPGLLPVAVGLRRRRNKAVGK